MAHIIIGSLKINCIHSGAVVNIGDFIFSLPSNTIKVTAGSNSLCSGDGLTSIAKNDQQSPGDNNSSPKGLKNCKERSTA